MPRRIFWAGYTAPLCAAYKSYAEEINPELSEGLYIEPGNLSLSFKRDGELRRESYFSSGFTALSDICLLPFYGPNCLRRRTALSPAR